MTRSARVSSLLAALAALLLCDAAAAQGYEFSESCAPTTEHRTFQLAPDALFIVDVSGSMNDPGGLRSDDTVASRIEIARQALRDTSAAAQNEGPCTPEESVGCDDVRIGLGQFSNMSNSRVIFEPEENARASLDAALDDPNGLFQRPNGGTQLGEGGRLIHASPVLANPESPAIGVVVTDGGPDDFRTVERGLYHLCAARDRAEAPVTSYMVGFGPGSREEINSLLAAAGGTGACCENCSDLGVLEDPSEIPEDRRIDVCALMRRPSPHDDRLDTNFGVTGAGNVSSTQPRVYSTDADGNEVKANREGLLVYSNNDDDVYLDPDYRCTGSLEAKSGEILKQRLLSIIERTACTFPLEVPEGYPTGAGAFDDPAATRVEFTHEVFSPPNVRTPVINPADPGALPRRLHTVHGVPLELAEENWSGEGWKFGSESRRTIELSSRLCREVRSNNVQLVETQVACLCPRIGERCEVACGHNPEAGCVENLDGEMIQAGRCGAGRIVCEADGLEVCRAPYSPQPEICNGLDDDCDGVADDLSDARPPLMGAPRYDQWDENMATLETYGHDIGLFCSFDEVCGCTMPHEYGPVPDPNDLRLDGEWRQLLVTAQTYKDRCACSAGLEPAPPYTPAPPSPAPQAYAAPASEVSCAALPGRAPSPAALLLLIAGLAWARRRRAA